MKNNHFSKKAKKSIIITGIAVICVGIVSAVAVNANSEAANKNTSSKSSTATITLSSDSVSPNSISGNGVNSDLGKTVFNPETESSRSEPLTTCSKPSSTPSKPVIEGDSKNGSQPTNSGLTDKSKKPTYTTTPKASNNTSSSTKKSSTSSSKSTSGSTKGNPILDNAIKEQGGNQETTVGNPGDELTGDKVGTMD